MGDGRMTENDPMADADSETGDLLRRAIDGDREAVDQLFARYRSRLQRMVSVRMDRRMRARFDPSDVVQETLICAADRLPRFARERPIPFYPWLRHIAWEQLVKLQEKHLNAAKRSVQREQAFLIPLSDESVQELADRLGTSASGPGEKLVKKELRRRTRAALELLPSRDREILELRYLEQLDNAEISAVLGITVAAVRTRHCRALQRLHNLLSDDSIGSRT